MEWYRGPRLALKLHASAQVFDMHMGLNDMIGVETLGSEKIRAIAWT